MKSQTMSIGMLLTAAGLLASAYTPFALGAETAGVDGTSVSSLEGVTAKLDEAARLLDAQKAVKAKAMLNDIVLGSTLTDAQRDRVLSLLARATSAVGALDAVEVALQSGEAALEAGRLLVAERFANDAMKASKDGANERASAVLAGVVAKRAEIAKDADALLARASGEFEAGQFVQSRSTLTTLSQSGVEVTEQQLATMASLQTRLVAVSEARLAAAGMLAEEQPGVVKPREEDAEPAKALEPEVTSKPKPTAVPEVTSRSGGAAATPSGDEMIRQAQMTEAQAILAEAEQAFGERRLNEAQAKFVRVKNQYREFLSAAELARIDARLAECQALLGNRPGDLLQPIAAGDGVIRQETIAVFDNYVAQAQAAMGTYDWDQARMSAEQARLKINQNKTVLSEAEYQDRLQTYKDLTADIALRQEAARRAAQDLATVNLEREERERREKSKEEREEKIRVSLERVRALQQEMKYEEAIQVCDNILFLDPINPSAQTLRAVLIDVSLYRRMGTAMARTRAGIAQNGVEAQEALHATSNLVDYPSDWEQISARRGGVSVFQDSPENRRTLALLNSKKQPATFKDNTFADVLKYIQAVTQVNMDIDWASLELVGVDRDRPITLELSQVPVSTILDRVMEKVSDDPTNGAAWAVYDGVLTIESREQLNRKTKLQVYDIRDLLINVPNFTNAPEFDLQQAMQSRRGGGGGQAPFRDTNQGQQNQQDVPTIQERQDELIRIITENVDRDTWVDNGGSVGKIQRFQGNLIVTQTPGNHRQVDGLLSELRKYRAMQINVETRFLLVRQDWFEQIGLDLDVYFNAKNNQVRTAQGAAPQANARDFFDFTRGGYQGGAFTPTPMDVNRDGDTDDANEGGQPMFGGRPSPLSPVSAEQNSLGLTESLMSGQLATSVLQAGPALGVAGQFLDDIQVDFLVKATQADNRSVTLTAPRVTLMNGQISSFYVVSQRSYVTDLTPVTSDSAVGFDPEVDVLSEGVTMLVEGTVSADRRYVTLNVDTSIARAGEFRTIEVTAVAGGQLVSSAETSSFIELPLTTVTRVQTTVSVPDQGTILMGGQRLISEQEVETGVPVLSKIPFLNRFFMNRISTKEEQTLLVLVKPTIIIQNEQEEAAFPGSNERFRTGAW